MPAWRKPRSVRPTTLIQGCCSAARSAIILVWSVEPSSTITHLAGVIVCCVNDFTVNGRNSPSLRTGLMMT